MLKKVLELIWSYEDVPFLPFVLDKILLVQTIIIIFIYLFALFIVQNFKKNSYSRSRVMSMHHFWAQNGPFALNNFFFLEKINIIFIYLLTPKL